jgi:steroid 5-alpha reductase family enzyme
MQRLALALIVLLPLITCSQAFVVVQKTNDFKNTLSSTHQHQKQHLKHVMTDIRGGSQLDAIPASLASTAGAAVSVIASSIQSGPYGVLGLTGLASTILLPLTQIRNTYGISIGYGLSVAAMAMVLRTTIGVVPFGLEDVLTAAVVFYGLRLSSFLLLRDLGGWKPPATRADPARVKRIPFALSLALFYAFMTTPILYALRAPTIPGSVAGNIAVAGTALAWFGALLEAVADGHKFIRKFPSKKNGDGDKDKDSSKVFKGPSNGVYRLTRHPNYTGEVIFWFGTYLAGAPSFGRSIIAWAASSVGLYGIYSIMVGATKRLEKRHLENYGGQTAYESWKKEVPVTLLPFVKG